MKQKINYLVYDYEFKPNIPCAPRGSTAYYGNPKVYRDDNRAYQYSTGPP